MLRRIIKDCNISQWFCPLFDHPHRHILPRPECPNNQHKLSPPCPRPPGAEDSKIFGTSNPCCQLLQVLWQLQVHPHAVLLLQCLGLRVHSPSNLHQWLGLRVHSPSNLYQCLGLWACSPSNLYQAKFDWVLATSISVWDYEFTLPATLPNLAITSLLS